MKKIAVFASGTGTNAAGMIRYFHHHPVIAISLILSSRADAGVMKVAAAENILSIIIDKEKFLHGNAYVDELKQKGIEWIVLAGFLWKIPDQLIRAFPGRIINIHPALLPKHGGKGMYGRFVHEAVINAGEKESGISIHYVDEEYDRGKIIFQATCPVFENDTPDVLAKRIQKLEHTFYPEVIEKLVREAV